MMELLLLPFMQYALLAALLASLACGMVGTLVTVQRQSFLAGAVAHAAYGGVGIALFLGWPVLPVTLLFSIVSSLLMAWVAQRFPGRMDSLIGILWAAGMSLGILLVDLTAGYHADLMSYLFGSIMAVSLRDLIIMAGADAVMVGYIFWHYKDFLAIALDSEFARALGVPTRRLEAAMYVLMALAIVLLIQLVGLVLIMALLTIPPMIAEKHASSLGGTMILASAVAFGVSLAGLVVAAYWDLTSGATIVAVAVVAFALDALGRHFRSA